MSIHAIDANEENIGHDYRLPINCKPPKVSPGLIFVREHFLMGLYMMPLKIFDDAFKDH